MLAGLVGYGYFLMKKQNLFEHKNLVSLFWIVATLTTFCLFLPELLSQTFKYWTLILPDECGCGEEWEREIINFLLIPLLLIMQEYLASSML